MFDISFGELLVVFIVGLVVLGPDRLPVVVKTVMGWIRTFRTLSANVQTELKKELKLQEINKEFESMKATARDTLLSDEWNEVVDTVNQAQKTVDDTVAKIDHDLAEKQTTSK